MKRAEKAFTLVELLVVISIIAILLAVLMPALSKVKEQGRTIICGTNLKNYGLAVAMYANANGERFPSQYFLYSYKTLEEAPYCSKRCRWHYDKDAPDGSLWPYLKDKNVHMCPTFKNFAKSGGLNICPNKSGHNSRMTFDPVFSYSMNAAIVVGESTGGVIGGTSHTTGRNWKDTCPAVKIFDVRRPAQCMAFSEENVGWTITIGDGQRTREPTCRSYNYASSVLNDNLLDIERGNLTSDNIATYHKVSTARRSEGYGNCVFVDGHVAATWGLAGGDPAFNEYATPYQGYEKFW